MSSDSGMCTDGDGSADILINPLDKFSDLNRSPGFRSTDPG